MTFDPTITIGGLFTLLATLGLYLYQWLDKGRARKWAQEDAAMVAADLKEEAAKIADKVAGKLVDAARVTADTAAQQSNDLAVKVVDGMTAAQAAIKASNAFNEKLLAQQKEITRLKRQVHVTKTRRKS